MSIVNRTEQLNEAFNDYDWALEQLDGELAHAESYLDMDNLFAEIYPYIDDEMIELNDQKFLQGMRTFNQKASGNRVRFQTDQQKVRLIRIWLKYVYERNLNRKSEA